MATIDDSNFIDNIIKNNGFYNGDDEKAPDNPRCVKIVQYTNSFGKITHGVMFQGDDLDKYRASEFVRNPSVKWEYKK